MKLLEVHYNPRKMHCQNKNKYFSEEEADETAKHQLEVNGVKLRSYHCSDCGWWHLTKNLNFMTFVKPNRTIQKRRKKDR